MKNIVNDFPLYFVIQLLDRVSKSIYNLHLKKGQYPINIDVTIQSKCYVNLASQFIHACGSANILIFGVCHIVCFDWKLDFGQHWLTSLRCKTKFILKGFFGSSIKYYFYCIWGFFLDHCVPSHSVIAD